MDSGWLAGLVTAIIGGFVGLFGVFFGRSHWRMLDNLVKEQAKRIEKLDARIEELRREKRELHERFDALEADYYALKAENERLRQAVA